MRMMEEILKDHLKIVKGLCADLIDNKGFIHAAEATYYAQLAAIVALLESYRTPDECVSDVKDKV